MRDDELTGSLRIFGAGSWHARPNELDGVDPTNVWLKGESWVGIPKRDDTWILEGPPDSELHEQLDELWAIVRTAPRRHQRVHCRG